MNEEQKRLMLVRLAALIMRWPVRWVTHRGSERLIADVPCEDGVGTYPLRICGESSTSRLWNPTENISDAWMIVGKLQERFRRVEVHMVEGEAHVMLAAGTSEADENYPFTAEASTAPLAICLAADEVARHWSNHYV